MDASLLSFFPLFVYCLHALHLVLTLAQDVTRAHKVDGEDSRDWINGTSNNPRFFQLSTSHLPLCVCVCSVFVFIFSCFTCICVCCVCVSMLHVYAYVIFTLPTAWLFFRFEYNIARSVISPFSERNRGVTGMGTYFMKILTQTFLLLLLVLFIVI